jgi:predicted glycosyltransferase
MRILFDIVHPADVLFFLNPMRLMKARGDAIKIVSRQKDVAGDLLDQFGLEHESISIAGNGRIGLARELIVRDWQMLKAVRTFRPDVMLGFGGVAISHVGKLLTVPSVSFYAADTASLQTRITWPFIDHLYVPQAYAGDVPEGRTSRFLGIKELSYFHPENFAVDDDIARANGWDEQVPNYFVRTVSWRANHDLGKSGWSDETLRQLVSKLAARGKVHISSERPLPAEMEEYRYKGAKNQLHHVMAKCELYVGESATMAHEACLLGVPSIYDGTDHPGTTRELASEGLLTALRQPGPEPLLAEVDELLKTDVKQTVDARRKAYLSGRPNLAQFVVDAADRHALPGCR